MISVGMMKAPRAFAVSANPGVAAGSVYRWARPSAPD